MERPFLLYVGDEVARKNLPRLLEAWTRSSAREDYELVVAGPVSAETLRGIPSVRRLGYVTDEDLERLYASCEAFLYPTLYEGFGLPILEAMASGAAVLTSDTGASPEVAGGHAVTVNARESDAILAGIDDVLQRTPTQRAAAREHAETFSWRRCALQTAAVHRAAIDREALREGC